jgi:hypothetical protein
MCSEHNVPSDGGATVFVLIRALARAHRWNRMLEQGRYRSIAEIAEGEKIDRSFVSRLLRLTLLAPDIQEAILEGRQPKGLQLEALMGAMPEEWGEQRANVGEFSTRDVTTTRSCR